MKPGAGKLLVAIATLECAYAKYPRLVLRNKLCVSHGMPYTRIDWYAPRTGHNGKLADLSDTELVHAVAVLLRILRRLRTHSAKGAAA